ncbi:uncharacterized protein CLUP02_06355 [Colletotrichum lupini]|uniref:Uncharacterized protein n=1 Tax=Colletotrichum lupini TaxID=145971 RepID=A0A9Q8WFM6_9PEZI|nr:uncharacterized protein CLUP02_06355 [Colletotrichum lupini]UQC80870.1 hypothetical protein CLUP02_06355 [Colletotrichum lupini]
MVSREDRTSQPSRAAGDFSCHAIHSFGRPKKTCSRSSGGVSRSKYTSRAKGTNGSTHVCEIWGSIGSNGDYGPPIWIPPQRQLGTGPWLSLAGLDRTSWGGSESVVRQRWQSSAANWLNFVQGSSNLQLIRLTKCYLLALSDYLERYLIVSLSLEGPVRKYAMRQRQGYLYQRAGIERIHTYDVDLATTGLPTGNAVRARGLTRLDFYDSKLPSMLGEGNIDIPRRASPSHARKLGLLLGGGIIARPQW